MYAPVNHFDFAWRRFISGSVGGMLALVVLVGSSHGSLVCPDLPEFRMEEASSTAAPADSVPSTPAEQPEQEYVPTHAVGIFQWFQ